MMLHQQYVVRSLPISGTELRQRELREGRHKNAVEQSCGGRLRRKPEKSPH